MMGYGKTRGGKKREGEMEETAQHREDAEKPPKR